MNECNVPTGETPQNDIRVGTEDVLACKNPHELLAHPKMQQFLDIFNRHRNMLANRTTRYSGAPNFAPPITIDDLKKSKEVLQEAYVFFQDHLVICGRTKVSGELASKVHQTFKTISEQIDVTTKAQSALFGKFEPEDQTVSMVLERQSRQTV